MSSRILSLNRGRQADNQRFSTAFAVDAEKVALLEGTLNSDVSDARRQQLLSDPYNCSQFICPWGNMFGFLTRPVVSATPATVCGSWTDTIGQAVPVTVPLATFQGGFTTLASKRDARRYGLVQYPKEPDTILGPAPTGTRNAPAIPASSARLNWDLPEDAADDDHPVIVYLPNFLFVGPGQTALHNGLRTTLADYEDSFHLLNVYLKGCNYAMTNNNGRSVTKGGPLFQAESLADLGEGVTDPFEDLAVTTRLFTQPAYAVPGSVPASEVEAIIKSWSDIVWIHLGGNVDAPLPVPDGGVPRAGGPGADDGPREVQTVTVKEKDFRSYERSQARWRIFPSGDPAPDSEAPTLAVVPELLGDFDAYLRLAAGAQAAEDLQEMVDAAIRTCYSSKNCHEKDVTFRKECITLAFSDRVRTFKLVSNLLVNLSFKNVQDNLGFLQFLTPVTSALAAVAEGDSHARTMVMANSTDSKLLTVACEKSKMYTAGHIETFRHIYEGFCNFRMFLSLVVGPVGDAIVMMDNAGKAFWDAYCRHPWLAVHCYQDVQHIINAFVAVALDTVINRGFLRMGLRYRATLLR